MPAESISRRQHPRVRIVHLGLGAFHRAHQAWYTAVAAPEWGIAAFTGRRADAATVLRAQDCAYTLIERSDAGDRAQLVESIVEAHDGADLEALRELVARPEVTVVTLTITEKGYHLGADGRLDVHDPDVLADAAALGPTLEPDARLRTAPARLLCALRYRHLADAGPIAVIPCDNLTSNGPTTAAVLKDLARLAGADTNWIDESVDVIGTSVDRITPRTTASDIAALAAQGVADAAPVITEPFRSWVLAGRFRGERPAWEHAGALFVDDVEPFERRKLWMLNGAHSLLAYAGLIRGHETVAHAIADPECRADVHALWDLDERHLASHPELHTDEYRRALQVRFENSAIAHSLRQIAADGSAKLRNRVLEVLALERGAGRGGDAALAVIAAWARFVRDETRAGRTIDDAAAARIAKAVASPDPVRALLAIVSPELADDVDMVRRVQDRC